MSETGDAGFGATRQRRNLGSGLSGGQEAWAGHTQASARQDLILGSNAWHLGLVGHTLCTKRAASWLPLT